MPELRVEIDPETADALQAESELLGFDDREAYLAWIVENRAAIEQGTESAELLSAYRERVVALEERLAAAGVDPDAVADGAIDDGDEVAADEGGAPAADDGDAPAAHGSGATATDSDGDGPVADDAGASGTGDSDDGVATAAPSETDAAETDAAEAAGAENADVTDYEAEDAATATAESADADDAASGTVADAAESADAETDSPDRTADPADAAPANSDAASANSDATSANSDAAPACPDDASASPDAGEQAASDGGSPAGAHRSSVTGADVTSMHLKPERVQRVSEDPVAQDAGELSDVETRRVDELSRRAVARTREELDRDVETGLSYSSSPSVPPTDVRPGEDLAELDAIEVPGRSDGVVSERREVVGRALAFLRDEGEARRSAFVDALYGDHSAGYETADGWWRCVREGLRQVEAVDGGHVWRYVD